MANQPIDNRDLRIFDLNVNESLNNIAEAINNNTAATAPMLEEIVLNLAGICGSLARVIMLYENK
jgi:hypothetical protein